MNDSLYQVFYFTVGIFSPFVLKAIGTLNELGICFSRQDLTGTPVSVERVIVSNIFEGYQFGIAV
jgi:hypothetical protein